MITIATNMAGRGTDIQLGGNKNILEKESSNINKEIDVIKADKDKVKNSVDCA